MKRNSAATAAAPKSKYGLWTRAALTLFFFLAGVGAVLFSYNATWLGIFSQWIVAIISLSCVGILIGSVNGVPNWYGAYLLPTKRGIWIIEWLSGRYERFWTGMSIWGLVLGFGLLSFPFLKGRIDRRLFGFGILCIVVVMLVIIPETIQGFQFINLPTIQGALQAPAQASTQQAAAQVPLAYIIDAVAVVVGLSGLILLLLVQNAASIVLKVWAYAASAVGGAAQPSTLHGIVPGVAPIIPGIDIPLFAGLASLAVLLVVHEASHGVLARIVKIKVKTVGLAMFGIIPIGAFVEPDEKRIARLESPKQTLILSAGTSANFLFMFVFAVLLALLLAYVIPVVYTNQMVVVGTVPGMPASGILKPGMQILYVNGYHIYNTSNFSVATANDVPGALVTVQTNSGVYTLKAQSINNSAKGYIGVSVQEQYGPAHTGLLASLVEFLYAFFALSLLLNFSLAVFNLLPLPFFDGWRLFKANVKNNNITKALAGICLVLILINLFSWVFVGIAGGI